MTRATIVRWGNDLALRLPDELVRAACLQDGQQVELDADPDRVRIRHANAETDVSSWFEGRTPAQWHAEYATAAAEFDWGRDVGRENVSE